METSTPSYIPTKRTQVQRRSQRGVYDKAQVHAILDEGFICHVGFVIEGRPFIIPTAYARSGEQIYIHGSPASRIMKGGPNQEIDLCLTVTLLDGLVLARSAFHGSTASIASRSQSGMEPAVSSLKPHSPQFCSSTKHRHPEAIR